MTTKRVPREEIARRRTFAIVSHPDAGKTTLTECWLHSRHADFYSETGLRALADCLGPDGVFGLWSASKPQTQFLEVIGRVFPDVKSHEVSFYNPHMNETDSNWIVIASLEGARPTGTMA